MATLFDSLPGLKMPVALLSPTLSRMWSQVKVEGHAPPSEFRASQMNLILHFGTSTSEAEAKTLFDTAILFAQRYPCRIVILCPSEKPNDDQKSIDGKLFSQCYIGPTQRQMCCCEAIILGYQTSEAGFLESQVSVWLENDLPVYHWLHRVPAAKIEQYYLGSLKDCTRVLYDSTVEQDAYRDVPWPRPEYVRDLAYARLLNVRQGIGQYLSGFDPADLVKDLQEITFGHTAANLGEGNHLKAWTLSCLETCCTLTKTDFNAIKVSQTVLPEKGECGLSLEWHYANKRYFRWKYCEKTRTATVDADLGKNQQHFVQRVKTLDSDKALAEALFF